MKIKMKALLASLALCVATSAFAADKPTLNDNVDAGVKAAIVAAMDANKAAKAAGVEWIWARPVRKMWKGKKKTASKVLYQAIEMANEGKNDKAKMLAEYVENSAKQGVMQAEKAKNAGPAMYGI